MHLDFSYFFHVNTVKMWLQGGGYGLLFGLLFSCGLGVPIPEDVPLIASGILIYHHKMSLMYAAPLAWLGIIGGDCVLYMLGRRYGESIVKVPLIGKHVTLARLHRAEQMFRKYGVWMVAGGRLLAGVRGAMVVSAGASRFKFLKFLIADGLAAIVSGGLFMFLGYWGGEYGPAVASRVSELKYSLWIFAAVVAIVLIAIFIWRDRNRTDDPLPPPK